MDAAYLSLFMWFAVTTSMISIIYIFHGSHNKMNLFFPKIQIVFIGFLFFCYFFVFFLQLTG